MHNFVPVQAPILVCCQSSYLYTIEFWGACDVYMRLDLVCEADFKVLRFEKLCKTQGYKVQKKLFEQFRSNSPVNLAQKQIVIKTKIKGSL